jgi:RHS repeat-associated protein
VTLSDQANGYVIADAIRVVGSGSSGTPGGLYYVHNDHLGTPQVVTDSSQQVVWQASYDPFGQATVSVNTITFNLRFPGQYYDAETGLHYNYYRYYDPETDRYITADPIGLVGGLNPYRYAEANPLSNADPFGLFTVHGFEMPSGEVKYRFEFTSGCIKGMADQYLKPKIFKRIRMGKKATIGDRYSGINDVKGDGYFDTQYRKCKCQNYDPALKEIFESKNYKAGDLGGSLLNENQAEAMIRNFKNEVRKRRKADCPNDDCAKVEEFYPWNDLIPLARERAIPHVNRLLK